MQQIIPVQYIKTNFNTTITHTQLLHRSATSSYYLVITYYGSMCLVIENYQACIGGEKTLEFLDRRMRVLMENRDCFPFVYEWKICVNHPEQIVCISLVQMCVRVGQCGRDRKDGETCKNSNICNIDQVRTKIKIQNIVKFIKCLQILQKQQLTLQPTSIQNILMYYKIQNNFNIDFTKILPLQINNKQNIKLLDIGLKIIQQLFTKSEQNSNNSNQFILIQDKIYTLQSKLLSIVGDIQQLMIMLNICPNMKVQIQLKMGSMMKNKSSIDSLQSPTRRRYKTAEIQQLQGNQKFKLNNKQYTNLTFIDGKCINALQQLPISQQIIKKLKTCQKIILKKLQHLYIQLQTIDYKYTTTTVKQNTITVQQPVQKIQFINFIIFYLKLLEPTIISLTYLPTTNTLKLQYQSRTKEDEKNQKVSKYLFIQFYNNYIVKDKQISMILQRAKLKNCRLDLRYMKINDTLLMFLANSEKTGKLGEINVSDCYGVSDNGINILVMSPYCKKLQSLSLILKQNLFLPAIQSLSQTSKPQLKKLYLQQNPRFLRQSFSQQSLFPSTSTKYDHRHHQHHHHHQTQLNLSKLKITQLYAIGVNIQLLTINLSVLKILHITQSISVQQFRFFVKLELKEFKVKIIDLNKKSIIQSTSSFLTQALSNKSNYIKTFAEGPSAKSLKILDLSDSNIKFKIIKPLLVMPQLEKLILNSCTNIGTQIEHISPKILSLSLTNTQISITSLENLLQKTPILVELNLINNTEISDEQLANYITIRKKFINNLIVCQNLYSNKLIQNKLKNSNTNNSGNNSNDNGFQLIQNVAIYVGRLMQRDNNQRSQEFVFCVLEKLFQTVKTVRFITKCSEDQKQNKLVVDRIVEKVYRFLKLTGKPVKYIKNLCIDRIRFEQIYQKLSQQKQPQQASILFLQNQKISLQIPYNYTISTLLHKLTLLTSLNSNKLLILNLSNNKTLHKQCIKMLIDYPKIGEKIIQIDFRNCLFQYQDVIQYLFQLPMLEKVNGGVCKIVFNQDKVGKLEKYLKFCMRIQNIHNLTIICSQIQETQILYSVLFHIVDNHQQLQTLTINFSNLLLNYDSNLFFSKIFDLQNLHTFNFILQNCTFQHNSTNNNNNNNNNKNINIIQQLSIKSEPKNKLSIFDSINQFTKLKNLVLKMPMSVMPVVMMKQLQKIQVQVSQEWNVSEHDVNKLVRGISMSSLLKQLSLNLSGCSNINNISKLFTVGPNCNLIQKLPNLTTINLNFQYCPIKQSSIYQLLHSISKLPRIKKIYLNFSYAITNLQQFLSKINLMVINIGREVKVYVIAVNQKSSQFVFNKQFCKINGVEFLC